MTNIATQDIERLILNCINRRNVLLDKADNVSKKRRYITFLGGMISILSAMTFASVTTKLLPGITIEIVAIVLAFTGGVFALFGSILFNESEIMHLYIGASKYLKIIEHANIIKNNHNGQSNKIILQRLSELQNDYNEMAIDYDRYTAKLVPCRKETSSGRYISVLENTTNSPPVTSISGNEKR